MNSQQNKTEKNLKIRQLVDTIGFAQYNRQMDSILARIDLSDKIPAKECYKAVICPHDDYAYAAVLYNKTLAGIKAETIVLIGVAHKARQFSLENKLIFDSFDQWKSTSNVEISELRTELIKSLPDDSYLMHDSMMQTEHSLEAILPFLLKYNRNVKIIPVLVPYTTFENMDRFSDYLSAGLFDLMKKNHLQYGKDIAIVISNDAIHYGNEDWGGKDMAPFGTDEEGNNKALQKDNEIITQCLIGNVDQEKIFKFNKFTVQESDFREYKWTWCGRYSVPFGLMLSNKLNLKMSKKPLTGKLIGYRSSLKDKHIDVYDLGMGTTAPAKPTHWVGYVGVGYE
ncbi:MAG: AmmeMemoRadiSam system protein B [Bacteroidales bacterium]